MLSEKMLEDYKKSVSKNKQCKISTLEQKLIELGYEMNMFGYYQKGDINILLNKERNKIFERNCCVEISVSIRSRNDIQKLKDNIQNYDEQLRIMQKDLEELRKYEHIW